MTIRVAIIEDDARLRASLKEMLSEDKDCECVGVFSDAESALARLPKLDPEVVIVDVNLPGMNGIKCVRQLSVILPQTQFLMVTVYQDTERIFEALSAGANGYLTKPVRADQLLAAIRDVVSGGAPLTGVIARQIIGQFRAPPGRPAPASSGVEDMLTTREQEVLELLVQGLLYKQVGERLNMSMNTVFSHIKHIYKKLQVHSRREAVDMARRK